MDALNCNSRWGNISILYSVEDLNCFMGFLFVSKYRKIASIYLPLSRFLSMKQKWTLKCIHKNTYLNLKVVLQNICCFFGAKFVEMIVRNINRIHLFFKIHFKWLHIYWNSLQFTKHGEENLQIFSTTLNFSVIYLRMPCEARV